MPSLLCTSVAPGRIGELTGWEDNKRAGWKTKEATAVCDLPSPPSYVALKNKCFCPGPSSSKVIVWLIWPSRTGTSHRLTSPFIANPSLAVALSHMRDAAICGRTVMRSSCSVGKEEALGSTRIDTGAVGLSCALSSRSTFQIRDFWTDEESTVTSGIAFDGFCAATPVVSAFDFKASDCPLHINRGTPAIETIRANRNIVSTTVYSRIA